MPRARARRHESADGDVLCAVPCHLCTMLGCDATRESTLSAAFRAPEDRLCPPVSGLCNASPTTTCSTYLRPSPLSAPGGHVGRGRSGRSAAGLWQRATLKSSRAFNTPWVVQLGLGGRYRLIAAAA